MELGLTLPHTGAWATPAFLRDFAVTAETEGLDGLWGVDHMVLPYHVESDYVLGRAPVDVADGWLSTSLAPNFEMHTTLTWIAAHTSRVALGTAVAVLPIRNAVANARQLATLDVLSAGRVVYGVGVGWMREEADAMGMPWDRRGRRSDEHIALLRALWTATDDLVEFHGEFHDLPPMDPEPRPVQRPIPILIGGHSDVALARTVRLGDGWIAAPMSTPRLAELIIRLHTLAEDAGRDPASLRLVASTGCDIPDRAQAMADIAGLGVDHLQVLMSQRPRSEALDTIAALAADRPEA